MFSALGPRSNADAGIVSQGTRAIVQAMQVAGARRAVVVSSAAISTIPSPGRPNKPKRDPGEDFFMRSIAGPLAKYALRKVYADLALMEDTVLDSGLDWTVIRPDGLTDKPRTGTYRTAYWQNVRRGYRISRADVAHLMLHVLNQPETIKQAIAVAY